MSGVSEAAAPEVQFRSDVTVELVRSSASDSDVLFAARVSTLGEKTLESASAGPADPRRRTGRRPGTGASSIT